jgi:Tfp pilus assembly protein PilF
MLKTKNPQNPFIIFLTVVFIFLATTFIFSETLKSSFLNWDDNVQISQNTLIRDVSPENILKMLIALDPELHIWQPIPRLSYSLDYQLYELAPSGYHLTSLLIHGANTCLVLGIFYCLVLSRRPDLTATFVLCFASAMTALTFGIHPLRVEPVAWVSSRDELLCAFFFLAAVLTYILYGRNTTNIRKYSSLAIAWLFFLFALMSKAMAISLPLVLLLLDVYPLNRIRNFQTFSCCIAEKTPFLILSIFSGIMTLVTRSSGDPPQTILELNIFTSLWQGFKALLFHQTTSEAQSIGLAQRAILSVQNIWFYVKQTLWPKPLLPYYSVPENLTFTSGTFWFSLVFTFIITAIGIRQFKRGEKIWFIIWGYYLVTIFPVLGFIYSGYRGPSSDRYTYISTLSFYFLIGLTILWVWENRPGPIKTNLQKVGAFTSCMILVCSLTALTFQQIKIWKDGESFWSYLLESHPQKAFVLTSMGDHYRNTGQIKKAEMKYQEALIFDPDLYTTRNNLGLLYSSWKPKIAEQEFKVVLKQTPDFYPAHNNLGLLYLGQESLELAEQNFMEALRIKPGYAKSHNNLGLIYMKKKQLKKAEDAFLTALKNQPGFAEAFNNLGTIYMTQKEWKKAEKKFEEALTVDPNFEPAFRNLLKLHERGKI